MYSPLIASALAAVEKRFNLSGYSFYMNPLDIVAITAKKR
jgi:hypothetical protein